MEHLIFFCRRLSLSKMASATNDVDEHIDDVIAKLDLADVRPEVEAEGNSCQRRRDTEESKTSTQDGEKSTKKSLVDNLKRLLPLKGQDASGKSDDGARGNDGSGSHAKSDQRSGARSSDRLKALKEVKVDKLPQGFVCKYVGSKPCSGLWGVRHTRKPVDELVTELRGMGEGEDLPLVNVKVSMEGLKATMHIHNKSSRVLSDAGMLPLQFISYAVQDPRYTRIFVFILVREISSRQRKTECHAYLCSTDIVARKMALAMALAFGEFSKKLEGKPHRFQVDLRHTDELETELETPPDGTEFDA